MTRKSAKPKPIDAAADIKLLRELLAEQTNMAIARARSGADKMSASWMAKNDSLVLLVVNAQGTYVKKKLYVCQVLDVEEEEVGRPAGKPANQPY